MRFKTARHQRLTRKSAPQRQCTWLLRLVLLPVLATSCLQSARAQTAAGFADCQGKPIRSLEFAGDYKLRDYILRREVDSKVGELFDSALVERDRKKISGLGIFSEVEPIASQQDDSVDLKFLLKEVWTLLPLLSVSRSEEGFDWLVGLSEKNLLGFYLRTTIFYRRFEGENSYGFSGSFPRAFGKDLLFGWNLGEGREVDQLSSIDPLSGSVVEADYRYLNKYLSFSTGIRANEYLYFSAWAAYNRENWELKSGQPPPPNTKAVYDFPRYSIGAGINLGRIYYDSYFYDGADLSTGIALVNEQPDGRFSKWRLTMAGRWYYPLDHFNFACRAMYYTSSGDERIMPYYISGRVNVRGSIDKVERGDHFLGGNIELRWRSFESRVFYTQLVGFLDAGSVWGRYRRFDDAVADPYLSIGTGVRVAIKQFLGNIGRADVAYNIKTGEVEYYLSANQFF